MKRKYLIFIPILFLFIISVYYLPNNLKYKQLIWIIISLLLSILISKLKFKKILRYSDFFYFICILLLVLVLVISEFTNGSRAWFNLGIISFQPSEFIKIALILINIKYNKINIWLFNLINIVPMILIFIEPDTGGVISLIIVYLYFLFHRLNKKQIIHFIILLIIIVLLTLYIFIFNNNILIKVFGPSIFYRLDRLSSFINDDSIQSTNALISIATSKLLYFPEMFNDFYISYILSNNILLIFIILINTICILLILIKKNTSISRIVFYLIFFQCFYNLTMNLKLVPVIGLPYLFVSYGGSHILSSMILIGLVINKGNSNKVLA